MLEAKYDVSMARNQSMLQPTHASLPAFSRPRRGWTKPQPSRASWAKFNWHMQR